MEVELLSWLQDWHLSYCDGEWEHGEGITIETLDNPGWTIEINLRGTKLENKSFDPIAVDNDLNDDDTGVDWYFISKDDENKMFRGSSGPKHLVTMLKIFKD